MVLKNGPVFFSTNKKRDGPVVLKSGPVVFLKKRDGPVVWWSGGCEKLTFTLQPSSNFRKLEDGCAKIVAVAFSML